MTSRLCNLVRKKFLDVQHLPAPGFAQVAADWLIFLSVVATKATKSSWRNGETAALEIADSDHPWVSLELRSLSRPHLEFNLCFIEVRNSSQRSKAGQEPVVLGESSSGLAALRGCVVCLRKLINAQIDCRDRQESVSAASYLV